MSLSLEAQLDLFMRQEAKQKEKNETQRITNTIQQSVQRIKSVIHCQPEINHTCGAHECEPINEKMLIHRGLLTGPIINRDVYVCCYGRVHLCNEKYRECVIEVDQAGQGTCRISGRHYGNSSLGMVSNKSGTGEDGGGDDDDDYGGNDDEYNYESMGAVSYHPFNPPSTFAQTIANPGSRFLEKFEPQAPAPKVLPPSIILPGSTPVRSAPLPTTNTKKKTLVVQTTKITRKAPASSIVFKQTQTITAKKNYPLPPSMSPNMEMQVDEYIQPRMLEYRDTILEIIKTLFYSKLRRLVATKELNVCLEEGRKSISNDLRLIREQQHKGNMVVIPLFNLFVTYLKHITVHYTLINEAPKNPQFVEQSVTIILQQWRLVVRYLIVNQIPITPLHFTQHSLAILYEMRKGGREFHITHDSIPDSEYARTYMPAIELMEYFGYRKNYITVGFKNLIYAHKITSG